MLDGPVYEADGLESTFYHAAGSASMGRVVDTNLRVYGFANLRVCDASIIPVPICSHIQALCYALGEKAADFIAGAAP